ncbi:MAG: class I SAM-dependent RNA methyltransferase [Pseudomonadota bacterium]
MVVEVMIAEMGAQGDGVTADGHFVAGALPGEKVAVEIKGHRAQLRHILEPSTARVEPVCPHYVRCGGCSLQHADDAYVEAWKEDLVRRSLAARGLDHGVIRPVTTSPPASRRRATFTARRTRKGVTIGMHAGGSADIVPVPACRVMVPGMIERLGRLSDLVLYGASRKGEMRLTLTASEAGLDVAVTNGKPVEGPVYGNLVAAAAASDIARLSWNGEILVTRRVPFQRFGHARIIPPAGGFMQATAHGEAALVRGVQEVASGARRVADLFAGAGTFALVLAENAEVLAVESSPDAIAALDEGWRKTEGLKRVKAVQRDLFRRPMLVRELDGLDTVVIDPPRQGARAQCEQLALSTVPRIAMASCNPATFARDVRILVDGGFGLDWVQPIDQFRWSSHVELIASLSRI